MATRNMRASGRPPGSASTRTAILAAARKAFGATGYDRASLRAIATSAGVDPSTALYFFGSKEDLFKAVIEDIVEAIGPLLKALEDGADGQSIVKAYLSIWEDETSGAAMRAAVRSAMSSERAMQLYHEMVVRRVRLALINYDELHAEYLTAQLVGLSLQRYITRPPELSRASIDTIAETFGPLLDRTLSAKMQSSC